MSFVFPLAIVASFFLTSAFCTGQQTATLINNKKFVEYISQDQIKQRVQEIGREISRDLEQQNSTAPASNPPLFIGVLNGAVIFFADLVREVSCNCTIDFMKTSSYGDKTKSSGVVTLQHCPTTQLAGRDVIIVEDIVDTGLSIEFIRDYILQQNPKSLRIAALLFKPASAKISFSLDYIGFTIPSAFVIGYGLDYAQHGRNTKNILIATE